jgi:hypothetical protein
MQRKFSFLSLSTAILCLSSFASAQEAGTFHVFPMVMAGVFSDGSELDIVFIATNVDGRPTACTVELVDMLPTTEIEGLLSLAGQGSIAIASVDFADSVPVDIIDVGYTTMTCDHAVTGMALQIFDPGGAAAADDLTTINPATRSSVASIPLAMDDDFGSTVVVAIVNDDSVEADFDVTVFDISDVLVGTTTVTIPSKTQLVDDIANLIPELLPVPEEDFLGSIRISSVNVNGGVDLPGNARRRLPSTTTRFYALGMFTEGTALTVFPATQLVP